ncbi:HET-domain-containing protein [Paraphaeosphaeria sporulosa]
MPFHHKIIPHHSDAEGKLSPKWFKSPKSPKPQKSPISPKSPKSSRLLTDTEKNFDFIEQCVGCNKVESLIKWNTEKRKNGEERATSTLLHNSFSELDSCSKTCKICRVFRQSLLLEEVTFDGVKDIEESKGKVTVHWKEMTNEDGRPGVFLTVGVEDIPRLTGVVNCSSRNEMAHLALNSNGRSIPVFEQAKEWLHDCRNNHIGVCDNLKFNSENPRLLIEILSSESIQLCSKQYGPCEYVALSYCWGDPKNGGSTTNANFPERLRPFGIKNLPATVRDALYIVHAMNVRYAWIDALCINQDTKEGLDEMHKVYSNALFTLCACATTKSNAELLGERKAWTEKTESCRLGGQWLTTPDMSLNQLRMKSPLAGRAWTLQEERLSPRMLYVSSSRVHWSCAMGNKMELKPVYEEKSHKLQRPWYALSDRDNEVPASQEFLLACHRGEGNLYPFWADIVKSYALRDMSNLEDRLGALSGLAARYLSANPLDKYLAGIWEKNLPEGLAWKVERVAEAKDEKPDPKTPVWPSWSWAVLPVRTAIETNVRSPRSAFFQHIPDVDLKNPDFHVDEAMAITHGEKIKEICVTGRTRPLWKPTSCRVDWSSISRLVGKEERFTFAAKPEQKIHAIQSPAGRVLVYEDRKREVVCQLDFRHDVIKLQSGQVKLLALELGETTMLLLEDCGDGTHRRVGAAWNVRKDFFALVNDSEVLVLR